MQTLHDTPVVEGGGDTTRAFYYLAGPMSGCPGFNFKKFNELANAMREADLNIVNPAELDEEQVRLALTMSPDGTNAEHDAMWADCLRRDLEIVTHPNCVGVVMMDGWEHSTGARLETYVAAALGLETLKFVYKQRGCFGSFDLVSVSRSEELEKAGVEDAV